MIKKSEARLQELWAINCPDLSLAELGKFEWLNQASLNLFYETPNPVEVSDYLSHLFSSCIDIQYRKKRGQFFTSPPVARFMVGMSHSLNTQSLVIDPGAGTGILIAALAERVAQLDECSEFQVVAYENDPLLRPALGLALGYTRFWLKQHQIHLKFRIESGDFILSNAPQLRPTPLFEFSGLQKSASLFLANPPYFKVSKADPRAMLLSDVVYGQPNLYVLFMAASARLLQPNGQMIFVTPRSFCSGSYFRRFRKWFFSGMSLERLHLFQSRTEIFERDDVLQETIILSAFRNSDQSKTVSISSSQAIEDLDDMVVQKLPVEQILNLTSNEAVLNIPLNEEDHSVKTIFDSWQNNLESLGLGISTGPIVPFRTLDLGDDDNEGITAPVLWGQHINRMAVVYPLSHFMKPQRMQVSSTTQNLLLPNINYVLIRRFSPKEENSRITAAPYLKESLSTDFLGIENHVNYLYRPNGNLSQVEVFGLAAFLNSRWVDRYFRLSNGNTQVNATELRNMPFPPLEKIRQIGKRLLLSEDISPIALVNQVVGEELAIPTTLVNSNGGHMPKIEEAKDLLNLLGLPRAQRNELAALILLALVGLKENVPWSEAKRRSIRIHDMIVFIEQNYRRRYAENTRETFRRQVLHQFEQARIVDRNPDDPILPTNSPRTHYAVSEAVLPAIQNYGTKAGPTHLERFRAEQGTLLEMYQQSRQKHLVPILDTTGREYHLSPGKHNQLQAAVIEQFAPRFAPGSRLLYLGDTAHKTLVMDTDGLHAVGFSIDKHGKLPDIVLHLPKKHWLFLIEVVTAHGPVSPKRYQEIESLLAKSKVARVYVSVFPDFKEFLRHARNIAWETEIWIAEAPDHMIHYNGDKFIGPFHSVTKRTRK